jgi:hypothetical protein
MRRIVVPLSALALAVMTTPIPSAQTPASGKTLDIYFIDTEGGQATLDVSPSGQALLPDESPWPRPVGFRRVGARHSATDRNNE